MSSMRLVDKLENACLEGVNALNVHDCDQLGIEAGCWLIDDNNKNDSLYHEVMELHHCLFGMIDIQFGIGSGQPSND